MRRVLVALFVIFALSGVCTNVYASSSDDEFEADDDYEADDEFEADDSEEFGSENEATRRRRRKAGQEKKVEDVLDSTEASKLHMKPLRRKYSLWEYDSTGKLILLPSGIPGGPFEWTLVLFLFCFMTNYFIGRTTNKSIALSWLKENEVSLRNNFTYVGVSPALPGEPSKVQKEALIEVSPSCYRVYCTGRRHCKGLIITLDLCPRHDIFGFLFNFFRGSKTNIDTVTYDVPMFDQGKSEMESFTFALCGKSSKNTIREEFDIARYAPRAISTEALKDLLPGLHRNLSVFSDCPEVAPLLFSKKDISNLGEFQKQILHMKFTDCAGELINENVSQMSKHKIRFKHIVGTTTTDINAQKSLLQLLFTVIDKVGESLPIPARALARVKKKRKVYAEEVQKMLQKKRSEKMMEEKQAAKQLLREQYSTMSTAQKKAFDKLDERRKEKARRRKTRGKTRKM